MGAPKNKLAKLKTIDTKAIEQKVLQEKGSVKVESSKEDITPPKNVLQSQNKKTQKEEHIKTEKETISCSLQKTTVKIITRYTDLKTDINRSELIDEALIYYIKKKNLKEEISKLLQMEIDGL